MVSLQIFMLLLNGEVWFFFICRSIGLWRWHSLNHCCVFWLDDWGLSFRAVFEFQGGVMATHARVATRVCSSWHAWRRRVFSFLSSVMS